MTIVQANPEAEKMLGRPITAGLFITGNIQLQNSSGDANLEIPLSGPKGEGTLYLEAIKVEGRWQFQKLTLVANDGSNVDLLGKDSH
jgi:hypothetical protein